MSPKQEQHGNIVRRRPAETATPIAMVVAMLIAKLAGVEDAYTVGYIAIVVAFVPTAITWLVTLVRG